MADLPKNLRDVAPTLERFGSLTLGHFINGDLESAESGETFQNHTPIDNSPIGKVAAGTASDIDRACQAAEQAFPAWSALSGKKRRELLHQVADAIEANAEEIALIESYDTGQPLRFMSKAAIRGAENFRYFADLAPTARTGWRDYPVEHAFHAIDVENRPCLSSGLYGRTQTR